MKNKILFCALFCVGVWLLSSCSSTKLAVTDVAYQSVRNVRTDLEPKSNLRGKATILVEPQISADGGLIVYVTNLTDSIMIIDRTQSFYISPSGASTIYYDPTISTHTTSHTTGEAGSVGVNLGAIGSALGVGGPLGRALGGINVGSTDMSSTTNVNTTYRIDTPTGSIAPRGRASMSRTFSIVGIGESFCKEQSTLNKKNDVYKSYELDESYCKFGVCISYSIDGGKSYQKIVSEYYANSFLLSYVKQKGLVNQSLREVIKAKSNLFNEPWFLLHFNCNAPGVNKYFNSELYDYK